MHFAQCKTYHGNNVKQKAISTSHYWLSHAFFCHHRCFLMKALKNNSEISALILFSSSLSLFYELWFKNLQKAVFCPLHKSSPICPLLDQSPGAQQLGSQERWDNGITRWLPADESSSIDTKPITHLYKKMEAQAPQACKESQPSTAGLAHTQ